MTRIRWQDDPDRLPRFTGHAGILDEPLFALYPPDERGRDWLPASWLLTSRLPGQLSRQHVAGPDGGREDCEARAEEWLAEFVSSLGAVFPEDEISDDEEFDEEAFRAQYAPGRRVRFEHPDAGWPGEGKAAREILVFGAGYRITWSDIGQSATTVALEGVEGAFNSVLFEPVDDEPEVAT